MRSVVLNLLMAAAGFELFFPSLVAAPHQNCDKEAPTQAVTSNPSATKPASTPSTKIFLERLKAIAGTGANDCGTTSSDKPDSSVSVCGSAAFQGHKAFFLSYSIQDRADILVAYGLAGNATGDVFAVNYLFRGFPGVPPDRHTQLLDDNHVRVSECIKPVILDKTEGGLLACVTPVNREESARVATHKVLDTTVCSVLANPAAFNNKLVRIRGHFSGNFEYSLLSGDDCERSLWFSYGDGGGPPSLTAYVSGAARPGSEDLQGRLILPVPVKLVRDLRLKRFEKQTEAMAKADAGYERKHPNEFASHCVTATFIGRIDAVSAEIHEFRVKHKPDERADFLGFGQMGLYEAQLVVQSVTDDAILERCKN